MKLQELIKGKKYLIVSVMVENPEQVQTQIQTTISGNFDASKDNFAMFKNAHLALRNTVNNFTTKVLFELDLTDNITKEVNLENMHR